MFPADRIVALAYEHGFNVAGVAAAFPVPTIGAYRDWLSRGYYAGMAYLAREDRVQRRAHPELILPGVRSIVCVGLNYFQGARYADAAAQPHNGRISRYAWGADYHGLMLSRLERLVRAVDREAPGARYRPYVDTGPVLERAYAARAGLGFIGRNTCLIHPRHGSWLFLGVILTDAQFEPNRQPARGGCGTCTRCIDACPTGALVAPYILDSRRCISYLTVENRGLIPEELRSLMGNRVFGCDVCQDVCPWQRFQQPAEEPAFLPRNQTDVAPRLSDLVRLTAQAFAGQYGSQPLARATREGLARNAVVALSNWGDERAAEPLTIAAADDDPCVSDHARWALSRLGRRRAPAGPTPAAP